MAETCVAGACFAAWHFYSSLLAAALSSNVRCHGRAASTYSDTKCGESEAGHHSVDGSGTTAVPTIVPEKASMIITPRKC